MEATQDAVVTTVFSPVANRGLRSYLDVIAVEGRKPGGCIMPAPGSERRTLENDRYSRKPVNVLTGIDTELLIVTFGDDYKVEVTPLGDGTCRVELIAWDTDVENEHDNHYIVASREAHNFLNRYSSQAVRLPSKRPGTPGAVLLPGSHSGIKVAA